MLFALCCLLFVVAVVAIDAAVVVFGGVDIGVGAGCCSMLGVGCWDLSCLMLVLLIWLNCCLFD